MDGRRVEQIKESPVRFFVSHTDRPGFLNGIGRQSCRYNARHSDRQGRCGLSHKLLSLLVLAALLLIAISCENLDTFESSYVDFREVQVANVAGKEKWIPSYLPQSATQIREKHNIDTNERWLSFQFAKTDRQVFLEYCKQVRNELFRLPHRRAGWWWPDELQELQSNPQELSKKYIFLTCDEDWIAAINFESNVAFFWEYRSVK